jgi:hypothetical protein
MALLASPTIPNSDVRRFVTGRFLPAGRRKGQNFPDLNGIVYRLAAHSRPSRSAAADPLH